MTTSPQLPVAHIVLMCYAWFSTSVYILVCIRILYRRKQYTQLQTSFYKIFLLNSIGDIVLFLFIEFLMRPRKFNYFGMFEGIPNVYAVYNYHVMFFIKTYVNLCYMPLALNRFMAFAFPTKYNKIWSTKNVVLLYVVLLFLSTLTTLCLYLSHGDIYFENLNDGIILMKGTLMKTEQLLNIIVTTILSLLCLALFLITAIKAKSINVTGNLKSYSLEIRLMFYCLFTTVPLLMENIRCWVSIMNFSEEQIKITAETWYFLAEFSASLQCWALLLLGGSVRKLVFSKKKSDVAPIAMFSSRS